MATKKYKYESYKITSTKFFHLFYFNVDKTRTMQIDNNSSRLVRDGKPTDMQVTIIFFWACLIIDFKINGNEKQI